jgi:phosphomannomutase/phosphoglucomutase
MANIVNNIFREYDIRGIVDKEVDNNLAYKIGRGFGSHLINNNRNKIAISGDVRHSTDTLMAHLESGLLESGVNVINLGKLPTPLNYYSMYTDKIKVDAAIQITGSHNPSNYNGFKITYDKKPFYGEDIQLLYNMIISEDFTSGVGSKENFNIIDDYSRMIHQKINVKDKMKVAIDCGNAAGCLVAPELYKSFNIDLYELYSDIDGDFPNHHPDPTVDSNLIDLQKYVLDNQCDVGLAFDGDADRIVAIDEKGRIIRSDILLAIFLPYVISKGEAIVYDVKCSKALEDVAIKYGVKPLMWKTGHSLIKNKMQEEKAKLGGEMSGHMFFGDDYFGYDDAIYVGLRLIELLSSEKIKLSTLFDQIPVYHSTPELRIDCIDDNHKKEVMDKAFKYFSSKFEYLDIDGIRLKLDNGWALIRVSNTQPVIVCRAEADSKQKLIEYKSMILEKLLSLGVSIDEKL